MKILQINKFFFLKGGAERHFFDLAELLTKKGHQVSIWSTKHSQNFFWPQEELFAQYSDFSKRESLIKDLKKIKRMFWNKEAKNRLEEVIKQEKPDIAHLHNIFSHFSPSIIYTLKKHNIPIVMTLHDYKMFCPNYKFFSQEKLCFDCLEKNNFRSCLSKKCIKNSWSKSLIGYLESKWQKDFLKLADKIDIFLAPTLFMKKQAIKSGIPVEKIIHLPHFIDPEFLKDLSYQKKSNSSEKYLLYAGRLSKEKGIDLLILSFLENLSKLSKWKLKIMGKGPEKIKLQKLAKGCKQIEFLGKKKGQELKEIIFQAYLVIVPSVWAENFPFSVLESFVFKKAVLAARIGGLPEMIKDKKTGLLFKPNNLIDLIRKTTWAVNNPKKIQKIGKQAYKEILEKCDPEKYYKKLIKIYERI
ncbi:glycosyltransferase family 4 protein [Patescibacteria group bacterium]|nr:glycosyltransferase family 4 protein [Patescibacteria group bacterium]